MTTSPLMMFEQGYRALEMLTAQIRSGRVPADEIIPAQLLIRHTCGCPSPAIAQAGIVPEADPLLSGRQAIPWPERLAGCRAEAVADIHNSFAFEAGPLPENWAEQLWISFAADLRNKPGSIFLSRLSAFQDRTLMSGFDRWGTWQNLLSAFRRHISPVLAGEAILLRAENLMQQARIAVAEAETRWQVFVQLHRRYQDYLLREAGQRFITLFDIDPLVEIAGGRAARLRIAGTYISMYADPNRPTGEARLILALGEQGRKALPPEGRVYAAPRLVPEDHPPGR